MKRLSFHASVRSNLRGTYHILFLVLPIGLGFGSFVPTWFLARALAYILSIPDNAPVIAQPYGWLWVVLFLAMMELGLFGGFGLGSLLNALILHLALGWSWTTIRGIDVCPEILVWWLEGQLAGPKAFPGAGWDQNPLYDSQLDGSGRPSPPSGISGDRPTG
jgi:hypothetical protein